MAGGGNTTAGGRTSVNATAADINDIALEVADNNSRVAAPPKGSDNEYDYGDEEEEDESAEEEEEEEYSDA